ncbi:Holliday junction resolvase/predicted RNase H-like HicB family nuclease [Mitsuaria sp. BK045]|uniref:restriction endonuclease n=1 Tax=unclassified Roseateles TaxID=2626991 RepID=UPI0018111CE5|nr:MULTISPECIES: restriction endonuclease [unclassified Roseateles]MBB3291703.1 Holliday junction resolvase/predicted RNase H-like HicB family nuclease [Mitsuaria sp. BK041]MBB3360920.1 Holliday junction resolvase/predicted RNase H-like HicB family nuclease [Mitsuaria sp. BK045]
MTDKNTNGSMPADGPWLFQEALANLGWSADPEELARRVRRLDRGIPAEDEFAAVCAWLGKCRLLHKLDQVQVPASSKAEYQVPDLLARFTTQVDERPVLIEVKTSDGPKLRFSDGYLNRLKAYATLVGMSLLIAWKHYGIWTLFEAQHMEERKGNHYIDLDLAMRQNLMCALAGDVAFSLGDGAGVHLRMRKDQLVSSEHKDGETTEKWIGSFDKIEYTSYTGETLEDLEGNLQAIFMCSDLGERVEDTPSHVWFHYTVSDTSQFGHRALVELLHWESTPDGRPRWREVMRRAQITRNMSSLMHALDQGLAMKIVRLVLHFRPEQMPDFLAPTTQSELRVG